jgi:hypothetical protein
VFAAAGDEIELTDLGAESRCEDRVAALLQELCRLLFALQTESAAA